MNLKAAPSIAHGIYDVLTSLLVLLAAVLPLIDGASAQTSGGIGVGVAFLLGAIQAYRKARSEGKLNALTRTSLSQLGKECRQLFMGFTILCLIIGSAVGCASTREWALNNKEVVQVATDVALDLIATRQLGTNTREKACLIESGCKGAITFGLLARDEITVLQRMQLSVAAAEAYARRTFPDALNGRSLGRLAIDRLGLSNVTEIQAVEALISAAMRVKT